MNTEVPGKIKGQGNCNPVNCNPDAESIGWTIVSREEAEERRGVIPAPLRGKVGDRNGPAPSSLFFDDLLGADKPGA